MDDMDRVRHALGIERPTCGGCRHFENGGCELYLRGFIDEGQCTRFHRRYYDIPLEVFKKEST